MFRPQLVSNMFFGFCTDRRFFWHRTVVGAALILVGSYVARRAFDHWGADLAQIYMAAWLLRTGQNVYDWKVQHDGYMQYIGQVTTWGHFYPPASSVAMLPATIMPYWLARELWFYAGILVLLYGLWRFMSVYCPRWEASQRVLILGLVMCSACIRWNFKVAQPAALILGLLGLFVVQLREEKLWRPLLIGGFVGCVKATFGVPFLFIAAAQRRYLLSAALVAVWGGANLVGILGHGGFGILADYRANMAVFERPDELNYPDPRGGNSLARTDWPYVLNAIEPNFARNNLIGHALTLLSFALLFWIIVRSKKELWREDLATLALIGPATAISMLMVYHHHYDIGILLLPLLAYLGHPEFWRLKAVWVYVVAVALYAGVYPYAKFAQVLDGLMGPSSVLIAKPLACVVCIIALVTSSLVLQRAAKNELAPS